MTKVALIHALEASIEPARDAFRQLWPDAVTVNILDDSLSRDLVRAGSLNKSFGNRMSALVGYAIDNGAEGVLFTCSAFGEAIETARIGRNIPVLKPDEAMVKKALTSGQSIGALVTFLPTIESLKREIKNTAKRSGTEPILSFHFVDGAIEALKNGNIAEHDNLIIKKSSELSNVDVVLLAQFSMAHLVNEIRKSVNGQVISSPGAAIHLLKKSLNATV